MLASIFTPPSPPPAFSRFLAYTLPNSCGLHGLSVGCHGLGWGVGTSGSIQLGQHPSDLILQQGSPTLCTMAAMAPFKAEGVGTLESAMP